MASNYGPNFGVRRSDEHNAIREGRFKTPATGNKLVLGTAVEIDPSNPGFMRQMAASGDARPGVTGLLVSEDQFLQGLFDYQGYDYYLLSEAPLGKYAVITSGAGTKYWFKNTPEKTVGARTIAARTMFVGTPQIGEKLGWTGTAWAVTSTAADQFMEVVGRNVTQDYIEAVLLV